MTTRTKTRTNSPRTTRRKMKAIITMKTFSLNTPKKMEQLIFKKYLINFVVNHEVNEEIQSAIEIKCKTLNPQTLVLYRGQKTTEGIQNDWFSASKSKNQEFAGRIVKINVINVPIIDINMFIKNEIGKYAKEEECIVLGGGTFYKNESMTESGFTKLQNGELECWYTLNNINHKKKK